MLKVTIVDSRTAVKLVAEGRLTTPWVAELELAWQQARASCQGRELVVDLSETTTIDGSGKTVLEAMIHEGARLIVKGVYTEYLVKSLMDKARHERPDVTAPAPSVDRLSILGSAERQSNGERDDRGATKPRRCT